MRPPPRCLSAAFVIASVAAAALHPASAQVPSAARRRAGLAALGGLRGRTGGPTTRVRPVVQNATRRAGLFAGTEVRAVVLEHMAQVHRCFESARERDPTLEGDVNVRFTLAADGSVSDANADDARPAMRHAASCVLARARTWRFPPPRDGQTVFVYPFRLEP